MKNCWRRKDFILNYIIAREGRIKMYKKEYDAEKNDKVAIALIVFVIFIVIAFLIFFPQQYKKYGMDRQLILETIPIVLLGLAVGGYAYWLYRRTNKITQYIKYMKKTGTRYPANIIRVEEYDIYFRGRDYKRTYGVIVDCDIDGKTYQLLSKPLCVNPMENFATGRCYVYVREDNYVISDFQYKSEGYGAGLNVEVITISVDEPITIKHVEDFADFKLK